MMKFKWSEIYNKTLLPTYTKIKYNIMKNNCKNITKLKLNSVDFKTKYKLK